MPDWKYVLDEQAFDLILMDVQMLEMDGLEASRRIIQESVDAKRPRLIALTANVYKSDRDACLAAGMDAYLSKPIQPNALFDIVDRQLLVSATD